MRSCLRIVGIWLALIGLVPGSASAATITFESVQLAPGDSLTLNISVQDVVDLATFGFDLSFDPLVLGTPVVARGNIFAGQNGECPECFFPGLMDPASPGLISVITDSLFFGFPGVTGGGILATLTFTALTAGDAQVSLFNVFLQNTGDPGEQGQPGYPLNLIPCDAANGCIQNGTVTVVTAPQPVPEPSTLALLGIGLAAMARKRLKRSTPG